MPPCAPLPCWPCRAPACESPACRRPLSANLPTSNGLEYLSISANARREPVSSVEHMAQQAAGAPPSTRPKATAAPRSERLRRRAHGLPRMTQASPRIATAAAFQPVHGKRLFNSRRSRCSPLHKTADGPQTASPVLLFRFLEPCACAILRDWHVLSIEFASSPFSPVFRLRGTRLSTQTHYCPAAPMRRRLLLGIALALD